MLFCFSSLFHQFRVLKSATARAIIDFKMCDFFLKCFFKKVTEMMSLKENANKHIQWRIPSRSQNFYQ